MDRGGFLSNDATFISYTFCKRDEWHACLFGCLIAFTRSFNIPATVRIDRDMYSLFCCTYGIGEGYGLFILLFVTERQTQTQGADDG